MFKKAIKFFKISFLPNVWLQEMIFIKKIIEYKNYKIFYVFKIKIETKNIIFWVGSAASISFVL
jgi:hypothetical protein